jgi:two-component system LytT family response regulator
MRILAVDDEEIALKNLELVMRQCGIEHEVQYETSPAQALKWLEKNAVDAALLDISMRQMNGLLLAKEIKDKYPKCAIIFVTGYAEYAVQAFVLKASGYLVKPVEAEDLQRELDYIQSGAPREIAPTHRLHVQCFGNFEVFIDGDPLSFPRQKSKELFAYLIDRRGAQCTMSEIADILWEDGKYDISRNNQIHSFLHDLAKALEEHGQGDILLRRRNAIAVDVSKLDCDVYRCLDGDPAAINAYTGEYMSQYSWAEFTAGTLVRILQ